MGRVKLLRRRLPGLLLLAFLRGCHGLRIGAPGPHWSPHASLSTAKSSSAPITMALGRRGVRAGWAATSAALSAPRTTYNAEALGVEAGDSKGGGGGFRPFKDLRQDFFGRYLPNFRSDWTDGLQLKSCSSILFLYFACLLPAVAFGGIAVQVTGGAIGVIEYLVSAGIGGMVYAIFSGQPMTLVGPTGLTLAFITALSGFCSTMGVPFLPVYSWCGLWTSLFMLILAVVGASNLIEYATQFTDDVFNSLLAVNFVYEASRSLINNFHHSGNNKSEAFLALNMAYLTFSSTNKAVKVRDSRYFNAAARELLSDFGPALVIVAMSLLTRVPSVANVGIEYLSVPSTFMLCKGREWIVPMLSVPMSVRLLSAIPAVLLTTLFYLDQNISCRVVNSPRHKMKKGKARQKPKQTPKASPSHHLLLIDLARDLAVLGVLTGVLSIFGLPWQAAATVQSLNHVSAMADKETIEKEDGSKEEVFKSVTCQVVETRITGFTIHALILASTSAVMLPLLKLIPMPVVSGIFLYLGKKVLTGNGFVNRVNELAADQRLLLDDSDTKKVGYKTSMKFTLIQIAMLGLLWTLKSFPQTALFFPSVIGVLVILRLWLLPRIFTKEQLTALDKAVG
ncbi:unnamed protein product [Chrysoparadoxa australica]